MNGLSSGAFQIDELHFGQYAIGTSQFCPDQKNLAVCCPNCVPQLGQTVRMISVLAQSRKLWISAVLIAIFVKPP
jgi:hypothetical protein